jgi:outer membrane immunogenic protein
MRRVLFATTAAGLALGILSAGAADYPSRQPMYEPASAPADDFQWGGLYGGIHAGVTNGDFRLGNVAQEMATNAYSNHIAQDLAVSIARLTTSGSDQQNAIGGFIGYNWLWENVVVGLELDYTHMQDKLTFFDAYSDSRRSDRGLFSDSINYTASARSQLGDYAILKLRAGYPVGRFLPFFTAGAVVAKQRVSGNYTSTYNELTLDPGTGAITGVNVGPITHNATVGKSGFNLGGAFGAGVDFAVLDNLFLRAEYQWLGFTDYRGARTTANSFRLGAGVKY